MKYLTDVNMTMYTDPYRPTLGTTPEIDYEEITHHISKELELFANIPLTSCVNNNPNSITAKYVSRGLTLYFILPEGTIWVSQIRQNPNVSLTYMSRQIRGKARNLGNPFDPQHRWVIERHKLRHRDTIEILTNIPRLALLEVKISYITIFEFTKESVADMKTVQIDVENKRAFWMYAWDSPTMMDLKTAKTSDEEEK